MLIISKKKDYYDGVVGTMGVDKTLVYDREVIEFKENEIPTLFGRRREYWGFISRDTNPFHKLGYHSIKKECRKIYDEYAYFIVGFCGKLYIGWKLYNIIDPINNNVSTTITYDNEYMKTILEPKSWGGVLGDNINYIQTCDALQMFRDFKAPVFIYDNDYNRISLYKKGSNNHKSKFFVNALLKDYEFYKVFDSFKAFQEVSMFMGGVLGKGEKEIIEVADKYKIGQHGFDKWSFRKEPENKKLIVK